jgi:hypothetical protein
LEASGKIRFWAVAPILKEIFVFTTKHQGKSILVFDLFLTARFGSARKQINSYPRNQTQQTS